MTLGNTGIFKTATLLGLVACVFVFASCAQRATIPGVPNTTVVPPAASVPVYEAKPEWFACKADNDCAPVESVCGATAGVNRKFEDLYLQFVKNMAPQVDCMPIEKQPPSKVGCVKQRCAVVTTSE